MMAESGADQNVPKEVAECIAGWNKYLQMVRDLCNAGSELSRLLAGLTVESTPCRHRAIHCQTAWEQLASASTAATSIVNKNVIASLQDLDLSMDKDSGKGVINQQIVCSGLLSMVNLQYQLSMTCCEKFSHLAACQCSSSDGLHTESIEAAAVARCFAIPSLFSPLLIPIPQRRWSEATPTSGEKSPTIRRWSMPWKLALPSSNICDKNASTPSDSTAWYNNVVTQEELQSVIALLTTQYSMPPPALPLPGVTLTKVNDLNDNSRISSRQGSWWGEGEELDSSVIISRKSSSSTETSSSCYSLHSRSTSTSDEGVPSARSHLYSMWSGSELPFIKLPESSENNDT